MQSSMAKMWIAKWNEEENTNEKEKVNEYEYSRWNIWDYTMFILFQINGNIK